MRIAAPMQKAPSTTSSHLRRDSSIPASGQIWSHSCCSDHNRATASLHISEHMAGGMGCAVRGGERAAHEALGAASWVAVLGIWPAFCAEFAPRLTAYVTTKRPLGGSLTRGYKKTSSQSQEDETER